MAELLGGVEQPGRDVQRVADIGDLAPHVADLAGDDLAVVDGGAERRHLAVARLVGLAVPLDEVARDEGAAQALAVGDRGAVPGEDRLVADILVDLAVAFERGVGDVAEEVVQQLVEQHRPQPLGQAGRVPHVDQQEGALLAPRLDVAAGEQVLERAEAQQAADLEHHVGAHRHDHGEDHRRAERIVEALVARDVQAAHQHQAAQDHDDVEDDLQAEIGQQRQPAQAPQRALALDLEAA